MASKETAIYINAILINCANSSRMADAIIREENLSYNSKAFMTGIIKKLESVGRDMRTMISPELADAIRKEVSENWETLSVHNIHLMACSMNDAQRQVLESCAAHIMDGTFSIEELKK